MRQAVLLGVAGIFASTQVIRSILYGANPMNIPTIAAVVLFFLAVGVLGLLVPAQRAARIN